MHSDGGSTTRDCKFFEPVVTDMGICYAFNSDSMKSVLKPSTFKESFLSAYGSDLDPGRVLAKGVGTGSSLNFDFVLDNNARYRIHETPFSFKLGIGSIKEVFQLRPTAKLIKPGFKMVYSVFPTEVVATERLKSISKEKRRCLFSHESSTGHVEMFQDYSQAACQFECMLRFARSVCSCTPWNLPFPSGQKDHVICDLYGNSCFDIIMNQHHRSVPGSRSSS